MNYNRLETSLIRCDQRGTGEAWIYEGEDQPLLSAQFPESFFLAMRRMLQA